MPKVLPVFISTMLCGTLLFTGCASAASSTAVSSSSSQAPVVLTLAAAASLEDAFASELIPLFEEKHPGITITGSYASSGHLQTQMEEGFPADVFMSAATKQMDALTEKNIISSGSVVNLLINEIVLIVPANSTAGITSFEEITKASTIALGDPESVPVGQYAQEALTSLGLWEEIQPKLSLGTDVTQMLNWVAEGSADAGIVYATDAAQMPNKVTVAATAPAGSLKTPVIYPVGMLAESPHAEAAALFIEFLQSQPSIAIFEEKGFTSTL